MNHIIPLLVAIPLGIAFILPVVPRRFARWPDLLANLTMLGLFLLSVRTMGQGMLVVGPMPRAA